VRTPGPGGVRKHVLAVRLTKDEWARLQRRARRTRRSASDLVRDALFDRPDEEPYAALAREAT